jgi:ABC-type nitrate/sulfonate/bicarbonate transport system substrate-binding protein
MNAERKMSEMEVIHYSRCHMNPTASTLAFQLGYLGDELNNTGSPPVELLLGDYAHYGEKLWMRHASNAKAMWGRSKGADTRAVAFSWFESTQPIYTTAETGIDNPFDLKGKRIAMIRSVGQPFDVDRPLYLRPYWTALAGAGLTLDDVEIVTTEVKREQVQNGAPTAKNFFLQVGEMFVKQLLRGEVDAIATSLPPEVVRFLELRKVYDGYQDPDPHARVDLRTLVVSGPLLREHRDMVVRIVARLIKAGEWAAAHPDQTPRLLAKDINVDEKILRMRPVDYVRSNASDCGLEHIEIMRNRKEFLLAAGLIEKDFPIEDWIDMSIVPDARALLGRRRSVVSS